MEEFDISIVIPAFNEGSRISKTLVSLKEYFDQSFPNYEVIVVDDGSTDSTSSVVLGFNDKIKNLRLISYPKNQGKGYAVRMGVTNSKGNLILFADADGSTPFSQTKKLIDISKQGFDVVIGSRALSEEGVVLKTSLHRKVLGRIFSIFVRSILHFSILDTQCGFKLFKKNAAKVIFPLQTLNGFSFDVELLYLARIKNFSVREVPVNWSNVEGSKVRLINDSVKMFFDLLKIYLKDKTGSYLPR